MWSAILRSIRSGIRVGLVLLVLPASANAQSGAGSGLSGRVTDISGAPMVASLSPSRGPTLAWSEQRPRVLPAPAVPVRRT